MSSRRWAPLVVLVLALGGCGGDADGTATEVPTSAGTAEAPAGFDGATFVSTSVTGRQLVPGTTIRLVFDDGSLAVRAGCNTQSAPYEVDGSTLRWEHAPATTMMACPAQLTEQDQWLTDLFTGGAEVTVNQVGGTLTDGEVTIELILDQPGD